MENLTKITKKHGRCRIVSRWWKSRRINTWHRGGFRCLVDVVGLSVDGALKMNCINLAFYKVPLLIRQ